MHRWYCSVSLRWKRSPGRGVCPIGRRSRGGRRAGASLWRSKRWSSERSRSWVMLPAAETTMFAPLYIARWYAVIARRRGVHLGSHRVERLGDLLRVVRARALEQQMLDEVRDSRAVDALVAR